jgi:hypothetical protein
VDRLRVLLFAISLCASPQLLGSDLSGLWKVTIGAHVHPSGRTVPARTFVHEVAQLGAVVSLQAYGSYPDAALRGRSIRGQRIFNLTASDAGGFPQFIASEATARLVASVSPDGRRIEGRDQHVAVVALEGEGAVIVRAVPQVYTVPVAMERLEVELRFVAAGNVTGSALGRAMAGDEVRLLARFAEPPGAQRVHARLAVAGNVREVPLAQDTADPLLYWSERIAAEAPDPVTRYLAELGPAYASLSVAAADGRVTSVCPRFLYDAIVNDYAANTATQCARPGLPPALRGADGKASARTVVRFERHLRQHSTLTWDMPAEVRVAGACPTVPGRTPDEDGWIRMRTATEYLVARRRLTDGIMSGLESLAALDAMASMGCSGAQLGTSSATRLLDEVDCAGLAAAAGAREACSRLQTQCAAPHRFSGLVDQTELAVRQDESIRQAVAALGDRTDAEAKGRRAQLDFVQRVSGSMNPWMGGSHFQSSYSAAQSTCRSPDECDARRRGFVCNAMKAQAKETAANVRRQILRFAEALRCIDSADGTCSLSSVEFRGVVRSAPELRALPPTRTGAPEDRALAGFAEFMVSDIDCRAEQEELWDEQKTAIRDFAIGTALTIGTAGLGSVAARVALTSSRARSAGLAMEAARSAAVATRLQRAALAIDVVDTGLGIATGLAKCSDPFKETTEVPPVNVDGPRCPAADAYDGPHLTGHYRRCVLWTTTIGLVTGGLIAAPYGLSRMMDDSMLRRAADALGTKADELSPAQREALLDVFRQRTGGYLEDGVDVAAARLKDHFDPEQIKSLLLKLVPDAKLVGSKLVRGLDGDLLHHTRIGDRVLTVTRSGDKHVYQLCSWCRRLAERAGKGLSPEAIDQLARIGSRLGVDAAYPPASAQAAFESMVRMASESADAGALLAAARRIPDRTLRRAADVLARREVAEAVGAYPARALTLLDQLARHGDEAISLFHRIPEANRARDLGAVLDVAGSADVLPRVAALVRGHTPEAALEVVRAAASFATQVSRGQPADWVHRVLRLAEDVSAAGPAVGGEGRMWATMTDVAVARQRLGAEKFADYLDAVDFFRRQDGTHLDGLIRNARERETANLQDVISGDMTNPVNNALEVVGTHWLVRSGRPIRIVAGLSDRGTIKQLPPLLKSEVAGFGARAIRAPGTTRTIEADTAVVIAGSRLGSAGNNMRIAIDWKNYAVNGELKLADLAKAAEALKNGVARNVLFLSPRPWSAESHRLAAKYPGIMMGEITPDPALLRFLDDP